MKKQYVISSVSNNQKVYYLQEYACFAAKFKTYYTSKKAVKEALKRAKICAGTQEILNNLQIEEY